MTLYLPHNRRVASAVLLVSLTAAGTLTACGGGSGSASTSASSSAAANGTGAGAANGGGTAGGANLFSDAKVQACLKAAGIAVPTAGARPSGAGAPPSGVRPSGAAGARPSGSGFGGGFGGANGTKIQAALKACGITLPARGSGAAPSASS
jgi:hypothetical protein